MRLILCLCGILVGGCSNLPQDEDSLGITVRAEANDDGCTIVVEGVEAVRTHPQPDAIKGIVEGATKGATGRPM